MTGTADGGRIAALAALALGLLLVAAALPRTAATILQAQGEDALAALGRGERVSHARLATAIADRRGALDWHDNADVHADLGALNLARASDASLPPPVRAAFLDAALRQLREGLALGPARPYAWMQLAEASLMRYGAQARLDAPLRLSLMTGRYEPRLIMRRVELGFFADRLLQNPTQAAIRDQVRLATGSAPRPLAEFARRRYALGWIRTALSGEPAALRRFEAAYFSLPLR